MIRPHVLCSYEKTNVMMTQGFLHLTGDQFRLRCIFYMIPIKHNVHVNVPLVFAVYLLNNE